MGSKAEILVTVLVIIQKNEIKVGRAYEIHIIVASNKSVREITPQVLDLKCWLEHTSMILKSPLNYKKGLPEGLF